MVKITIEHIVDYDTISHVCLKYEIEDKVFRLNALYNKKDDKYYVTKSDYYAIKMELWNSFIFFPSGENKNRIEVK
jgi:hypothetical protein